MDTDHIGKGELAEYQPQQDKGECGRLRGVEILLVTLTDTGS